MEYSPSKPNQIGFPDYPSFTGYVAIVLVHIGTNVLVGSPQRSCICFSQFVVGFILCFILSFCFRFSNVCPFNHHKRDCFSTLQVNRSLFWLKFVYFFLPCSSSTQASQGRKFKRGKAYRAENRMCLDSMWASTMWVAETISWHLSPLTSQVISCLLTISHLFFPLLNLFRFRSSQLIRPHVSFLFSAPRSWSQLSNLIAANLKSSFSAHGNSSYLFSSLLFFFSRRLTLFQITYSCLLFPFSPQLISPHSR